MGDTGFAPFGRGSPVLSQDPNARARRAENGNRPSGAGRPRFKKTPTPAPVGWQSPSTPVDSGAPEQRVSGVALRVSPVPWHMKKPQTEIYEGASSIRDQVVHRPLARTVANYRELEDAPNQSSSWRCCCACAEKEKQDRANMKRSKEQSQEIKTNPADEEEAERLLCNRNRRACWPTEFCKSASIVS